MNMWEDEGRVTRARENNLRVRLLGRNKSEPGTLNILYLPQFFEYAQHVG